MKNKDINKDIDYEKTKIDDEATQAAEAALLAAVAEAEENSTGSGE